MRIGLRMLAIALAILVFSACNSDGTPVGKEGIIGRWKLNLNAITLKYGDAIPLSMQTAIESQKDQVLEQSRKEIKAITLEFTENAIMVLSKEGEGKQLELNYTFDGQRLELSGTIEEQKVAATLNIAKITSKKLVIKMTGEDMLSQIKANNPDLLGGMMDWDEAAKGSGITIGLKKE